MDRARVDDITIAFLKIELFLLQNEPKLKKYFDQFKASIEKINWTTGSSRLRT